MATHSISSQLVSSHTNISLASLLYRQEARFVLINLPIGETLNSEYPHGADNFDVFRQLG